MAKKKKKKSAKKKKQASKYMSRSLQPVNSVTWIHRDLLKPNDYNPNVVPPIELELLKISILESGWTQPLVLLNDSETIIDGFHRYTVSGDPRIYAMTDGFLPCVICDHDNRERIAATIRHNRARGEHAINPMSDIVIQLRGLKWSDAKIREQLGMEQEEIERLADQRSSPERSGDGEMGQAWEPDHSHKG